MVKCCRCGTNASLVTHGLCDECKGTCSQCGVGEPEHRGRCASCVALATRLSRMLSTKGEDFCRAWSQLTIDKDKFYANANTLFGKDLDKLLTQTLKEGVSHSNEIIFSGTGIFMDEVDLKKKYNNKPNRLTAILDKANRMVCSTTGIQLIEDMSYTREVKDTHKRVESSSTKAETKRVVKKHKVVKAETAKPQGKPTTLTDDQKKVLRNYMEATAS